MTGSNPFNRRLAAASASLIVLSSLSVSAVAAPLFDSQGAVKADSRAFIASRQDVKINRGALNQATLTFELDGETVTAVRQRQVRGERGDMTWLGHVQGSPAETIAITARGNVFSGVIQTLAATYEISGNQRGIQSLERIDLDALPQEDLGAPIEAQGDLGAPQAVATAADPVQQDIMVVFTQDACDQAANTSGSDCSQLEADIVTTFAQMNQAYIDSGINIFANLTSMRLLNYTETGSLPLGELRATGDGVLDEVHPWREQDGADLVHMIQKNSGCGVAYTTQNAAYGFAVTAEACMLGNRTFAHETGHNQYALHDRDQHSGGTVGDDRYGYKRCSDGSDEDFGSPYFRTVMSYSCASAGRVGRFSNPNRTYLGVPYGVDPAVDPERGAFNVQQINETAVNISNYRSGTPATPPAAPSGLSASANGSDAVILSWSDNASDETGFAIERSSDNVNFVEVGTVGANVTSFGDNGLQPEMTYYYRVEANNGAGPSGYSNTASATTDAPPATVDHVAQSQSTASGNVTGGLSNTHSDNGSVQTITEVSSGGRKNRRTQFYSHTYSFNVLGGAGGVTLNANAWVSGGEGANFEYSTNGGSSWNLMFTVSSNASSNMQNYAFTGDVSGTVLVRVTDAEQRVGEGQDSVSIDSLVITSSTVQSAPPAAPSNLAVTETTGSSVSLAYSDNSSDEFGFEIWRGQSSPVCETGELVGNSAANVESFTDTRLSPETTYVYAVSSYNSGGSSLTCTNEVSATTGPQTIEALGNGFKQKGLQKVDVSWSGTPMGDGDQVDIVRDGSVIATTADDGAYRDEINVKGGGSYTYQVCIAEPDGACSPSFNVIF